MASVLKSFMERVSEPRGVKVMRRNSGTRTDRSSAHTTWILGNATAMSPSGESSPSSSEKELDEKMKPAISLSSMPSLSSELPEKQELPSKRPCPEHELALIPLTDDPDIPVITCRSVLVGVIMAILGSAVTQLFLFKPVHMRIQPAFLQIAAMLMGRSFALIPGPKWWNPGPLSIKEAVFSSLVATSASVGAFAIELLAAEELYFDRVSSFPVAFGILLSSQMIGYGWAGLLQPLLVYPSHVFYPEVLPSVSLFYSLFGDGKEAKDQLKFFKKAFVGMGLYEIFPTYITPAFQAVSMFCLTLPKSATVTNIFGGAQPFEGLGFLSLSADWSLVGAHGPFFTPLGAQLHHIAGVFISIFILSYVYTNSWYDSGAAQKFPFMTISLLRSNGTAYPIKEIINSDGSPNEELITANGLPSFTATAAVVQIISSLATTSAVTHVLLENYQFFLGFIIKKTGVPSSIDPHRQLCRRYKDFPLWGFGAISVLSMALALAVSHFNNSGLSAFGLIIAIILSSILTLAVGFLNALTGFHLFVSGVVQMLGGLLFPGNTFGNMWFTTFGASTVNQSMSMLKDLKLGQYMHLPQTAVVYAQLLGTFVGIFVNYGVMKIIVSTQREILLSPHGNGVFSGFAIEGFQAQAVSWGAFSKRLFLVDQKYAAIPLALVVGIFLPIPWFVLHHFWPRYRFNMVNMPLLTGSIAMGYYGATAGRFVNIIIGLFSQFYMRRYRPRWFVKYNYVLSAAFDGGAQVMILFLTMALQGGLGKAIDFPTYFLNPATPTPRDYCLLAR